MNARADAIGLDAPAGRVLIGLLAGVSVFLTGVRPTGHFAVDAIETVVGVALVVVVGARGPWWLLVGTAGLAGAVGLSVWPVLVAIVAFALAAWVSPLDPEQPARADIGAVSVGLTMVSFALSELSSFTGASALAGVGAAVALFVGGLFRLQPWSRRVVAIGIGSYAVVAVVVTAALGLAARSAIDDLRAGVDRAREAARLTSQLESEPGAAEMRSAAEALESANDKIDNWWTRPAAIVPIVAQHRLAGVELTGEASEQLDAAATELEEISLDGLRVVDGAVDVEAIRSLDGPVERFGDRLDRLDALSDEVDSPWLVAQVSDKIGELDAELQELAPRVDDARLAVEVLPAMLGDDEARHYLLVFTTPSEARGLGGFIGNYAIVEIDGGRMRVAESGRRSDLDELAEGVSLSGPPGLLATYGKFGLGGAEGGPVGPRSWSNLTMEPDWPSFATAAHELYGESHDEAVDGVIVMDPYVLAQLSRYTGPVETEVGALAGLDLVEYILVGQYASESRIDELEQLSERLVSAFLESELPPPLDLVRDLEPLIDEQRLLVWSAVEREQELLVRVGVGDGLPAIDGSDGFSLGLNNASGSKIDAFLRTSIDVARVEGDAGTVVRATVELDNTAPDTGFPDYVIGNLVGLPPGTSRLYLVGYASELVERVTVDGEPVAVERGEDLSWHTGAHTVELGPGEHATIVYEFAARATDGAILERRQPMAVRE